MARKPREWSPHTCYHVTCRGNRKNDIFLDPQDFKVYLHFFILALKQFPETPYELIAYCLMDNHVHLLIHTTTNPLGPLIQKIHGRYAMYFNKKYNLSGHLFQDRFYSDLVANAAQVIATSRYIHLNPIAAKMVNRPENYLYSSYRSILGLEENSLINDKKILSYFHSHPKKSRILYKKFVEMPLH